MMLSAVTATALRAGAGGAVCVCATGVGRQEQQAGADLNEKIFHGFFFSFTEQ
jgi:hypothetical protein